jgi:protein TonB
VAKLIAAPAFTIPGLARTAPATPVPQTAAPQSAAQSAPTRLTYGVGEARQPAPEYPPEAQRAGEEGTVIVQFTVDENGHITSAEASTPSPWPSLNNAAVRAVRDTWRFPTGPSRNYEVVIQFELRK